MCRQEVSGLCRDRLEALHSTLVRHHVVLACPLVLEDDVIRGLPLLKSLNCGVPLSVGVTSLGESESLSLCFLGLRLLVLQVLDSTRR